MKKILLSTLAFLAIIAANAQVSITNASLTYIQNFNTLCDTCTVSTPIVLPGWSIYETGTGAAKDQKYKTDLNVNSNNSGDTYSFGANGSQERALGGTASGGCKTSFGIQFVNNSSSDITSINIAYTGEQWRLGKDTLNTIDSLLFQYSANAANLGDTTTTWTNEYSLMLNSPNAPAVSSPATAIDGNLTTNQVAKSFTLPVTIPIGGKMFFKWLDVNVRQEDDGLAIDDLNITFNQNGGSTVIKPLVVSTNPVDNASNVASTQTGLTINFNHPITLGTGNVRITNMLTSAVQTIAVPSAGVTAAGNVVTLANNALVCNADYNVQYDSTCFKFNGANALGIYNANDWSFTVSVCDALKTLATNNVNAYYANNAIQISAATAITSYQVIDINGTIVASNKAINNGTNSLLINTASFAKGMYSIVVNNAQGIGVAKILVD
jgi:Bacterial Ig-like domain